MCSSPQVPTRWVRLVTEIKVFTVMSERPFELVSEFAPAGDQPEAIRAWSRGFKMARRP
jgi:hypothetical protein